MTGPGFYFNCGDGQSVLYALNSVNGPGFSLLAANAASYTYPVNGWTWFSNENVARVAFGLPLSISPPQFTFVRFMALFTPAEQAAIVSSVDTNVKLLVLQATANDGVTMADTATINGINYLVSLNILTAARATAILSSV